MSNELTVKPGQSVSAKESRVWVSKLFDEFDTRLSPLSPSNIPLACVLDGSEIRHATEAFNGKDYGKVMSYFENDRDLRISTVEELLDYLEIKEPWEDYDICVFDESLSWCVGYSHNDKITIVNKMGGVSGN